MDRETLEDLLAHHATAGWPHVCTEAAEAERQRIVDRIMAAIQAGDQQKGDRVMGAIILDGKIILDGARLAAIGPHVGDGTSAVVTVTSPGGGPMIELAIRRDNLRYMLESIDRWLTSTEGAAQAQVRREAATSIYRKEA